VCGDPCGLFWKASVPIWHHNPLNCDYKMHQEFMRPSLLTLTQRQGTAMGPCEGTALDPSSSPASTPTPAIPRPTRGQCQGTPWTLLRALPFLLLSPIPHLTLTRRQRTALVVAYGPAFTLTPCHVPRYTQSRPGESPGPFVLPWPLPWAPVWMTSKQ
jgi:hypothetical protein